MVGVDHFYNRIVNVSELSDKDLVSFFVYFLTVESGYETASAKDVNMCFAACDLKPPSRTSSYLSEGISLNKFVKGEKGYKLQRYNREELEKKLGVRKAISQSNNELRKLEASIPAGNKKDFLRETIDCFEAGANRATIVMCWILAIDHLIDFTFDRHITEFNIILSKNTDKRVKITNIKTKDDFSDIPEGKLIEFLRQANIISNDVKKILEEKIGIRNSSAHPSSIAIKSSKVVEFVDDLVENIVMKYKI